MRKLLALILIAMLALGISFAVVGCGAPQSQEQGMSSTPAETPPAESPMSSDSTMADTTGSQMPAEGGN